MSIVPEASHSYGGESADRLQFVVDAIPILVSYVDAGLRYQFNNLAYEQWFGHAPNELRGRHLRDVLGEAAYDKLRPRLERVLGGEAIRFEDEIPYHQGGTRYVEGTYVPDRDPAGAVRGFVAVIADVTQRKETEARLRRSAELETAINRVNSTLAGQLDIDAIVQAVTDAATALVGAQFGAFFYNVLNEKGESYMLYTLAGVPREAFSQFPMPRNTAVFEPTFRGSHIVRSGDITRDPRYGKSAPYHGMPKGHLPVRSYLAVPVVSRSGETLGGLFFGHAEIDQFTQREEDLAAGLAAQASVAFDNAMLVDQLRRRTVQAEEASRLKDEFLSTASHELRTPLNAILGWARMLRNGSVPADNTARVLDVIERNARLQAQLVEDLLEVSRLSSGKVRLEVRACNMRHVVESALDVVRPAAAAKNIALDVVDESGSGTLNADPDRLQQVVWNLLSNAVKFTPAGGRISVTLKRDDDGIEIAVTDTGVGIPPEFMPHLFDRFRQADSGHSRRYGGLGLGLAISKQLVELHGGTLTAESGGPDRGATFRVRLHGTAATESHAVQPYSYAESLQHAFRADALSGVHVLIVDDEADSRELMRSVLLASGAEVSVAPSAADALAELDRRVPDVLLSDIGMPGTSGYALIRAVRRRPADRGGRVPAAALTAYAQHDDRAEALRAGFELHVPKPVDPTELVAVVESLARRGKA